MAVHVGPSAHGVLLSEEGLVLKHPVPVSPSLWSCFSPHKAESILFSSMFQVQTRFPPSPFAPSVFSKDVARQSHTDVDCLRFSSPQSLSRVQLFVIPRTAACHASLSITNSWSLLKLMSIMLVIPSNHLILCRPLLLPPSVIPSIRVFSNESVLHIKWPK